MKELEFAKRMAVKAGKMLRRGERTRRSIATKGHSSNIVTDMDHASEEMICSALRREFPDHAFVAEERGARGESEHMWYVDPLDGTTNYAHGLPIYAVSIGYVRKGRLEAGAVYAPALDELYWARRGGGAWCGRKRLRVSRKRKLEQALVCTGFAYDLSWRDTNLSLFAGFLPKAQAIRRIGSAALDLCWTAAGIFDGYWELRLGPWDMAAGVLIAREAGARVTNLEGGPFTIARREVLAANTAMHRAMLAVLRKSRV